MRVIECPKCKGRLDNVSPQAMKTTCLYCRAVIDLSIPEVQNDEQVEQSQMIDKSEVFLEKGNIQLEAQKWEEATRYFKRVIDIDPTCAKAYVGLLLASRLQSYEIDLKGLALSFTDDVNFKMALKFADDELKERLESYDEIVVKRAEENAEIFNAAQKKIGYMLPVILSIPVTVIVAEIWFLFFWEDFHLVNGRLFGDSPAYNPDLLTWIGFIITYGISLLFTWAALHNGAEKKIKKQRGE